jgi:hypothetical protein
MPDLPSIVFLSYSHDSDEHVERALGLSQRLRQDGVDSWIDQYAAKMNRQGKGCRLGRAACHWRYVRLEKYECEVCASLL